MSASFTLTCPIRGVLKTGAKSKDGLLPSEEYFRVEAIKYLLALDYPKANFKIESIVKKFGNAGRNSLRTDLVVLDVPADSIDASDVDQMLEHALVLCEVKRENAKKDFVKHTQVKPLLDFAKLDKSLALYWDNVDQRVFWTVHDGGKRTVKEGPLTLLPRFGQQIHLVPLKFADTHASDSLLDLFDRIADLLHAAAIDPSRRYSIILQLLLSKLFDEHSKQFTKTSELEIQDYKSLGFSVKVALARFNGVLAKAANYYDKHLPEPVSASLPGSVTGETFFSICEILAPVRLIASKRDVVQTFYMKFAKGLYKWDLAQFFTPPPVTDFIVSILNPQFGEHIKDPACGSADFLTAAYHIGREKDHNYASCVWGADNSKNAVQVAILNMLLNGDGKSNIVEEDSLKHVHRDAGKFDIVVCNPPFGVKIKERSPSILREFALGHTWDEDGTGRFKQTARLVDAQEIGVLFAELCVVQTKPGGRIGIILPNGYLGNISGRYKLFRAWLLMHCRVAAICSFPRFTFKTSGADVSASIIYLQKREVPLTVLGAEDYHISIQLIEKVGWNLGDKKAAPIHERNEEDGSYIISPDGSYTLDADFKKALEDLRRSQAAATFKWLTTDLTVPAGTQGWSIPIDKVLTDPYLTLDPKRYSRKYEALMNAIKTRAHVRLGEIVDLLDEQKTAAGAKVTRHKTKMYQYVEIADITQGNYKTTSLRGWELPSRGKHFAEPGDLYLGSIWGSVAKWCIIPENTAGVVVTNGCYRVRIKPESKELLSDLIAFLCTENYAVQLRALARGSDGLAEVKPEDLLNVIIPVLSEVARSEVVPYVENLLKGVADLKSKVSDLQGQGVMPIEDTAKRSSHVVLV